MMSLPAHTLINPQNGNLAFKIFPFEDSGYFDHIQRPNYYSMILVTEGSGQVKADFAEYDFAADALLCFAPYQPYMVSSDTIRGMVVNFHSDFFCIHKNQEEVACNGVLFNNIYKPPFTTLGKEEESKLHRLIDQMSAEMADTSMAQYEMLLSYLKIFLITASRIKAIEISIIDAALTKKKEPFVLQTLKDAIEQNYKTKHSAGEYAEMLNISPKALAKMTKSYFRKTLTDLISERIVIEAKRELYLTSKPVKTIASELGFGDEYYFSRFFKVNADVSPQLFRETVGFARGEA